MDVFEMLVGDVGVDLGSGDVGVAELFLDAADIGAVDQQVGGITVAKGVGSGFDG